jgi:signal transduction histidine kinase
MSAVLLSLALAWVLFRHKSNEPMAVFLSFYLLLFGVGFAGPLEALAGLLPEISPPVFQAVEGVIIGPMSIALFMLFPDGRFVPSGMRWMVLASIPIIPAGILIGEVYSTASPGLLIGVMVFWGLLLASALYAQIYRYRVVSSMTERQQTKWVVYGLTLWVLFMLISSVPYIQMQRLPPGSPLPWWVPVSELIWFSSNIFLPVSLTIAVLRYRLYDIDIIINRTLVYSVLTLSTMGLYVFIVGYLGNLFQAQNSSILAFLSTGLVAVIFQPLRDRLQGAVNRLMYGERDNPISVLTKLGKQLEGTASPQAALSQIVESIAQTLMLPHAAIEFGTGSKPQIIASFGRSTEETIRFPIIYQADNIGNLVVAPRSPGEPFSEIDITLLENIAHQAGAAAQAAKLTADLQHSRQRLVTAREEERRRLRRDLHDGLGPQLASQTLMLDALSKRIQQDPASATGLLYELKEQSQSAIRDIRQLVYDLRPPALDELGLETAIREAAAAYQRSGLKIEVTTKGSLPQLPAAVEVAAYRISQEAITNVSRHAKAQNCEVALDLVHDGDLACLSIEVSDDGIGLHDDKPTGVGLHSMRERAEELGGRFEIHTGTKEGTRVSALLPYSQDD